MIQYFINHIRKVQVYFEKQFEDLSYSSINIFRLGKILCDKNNKVKKLIELVKEYFIKIQN